MKYLILTLILVGCYGERKATKQFTKAVIAYPELPAEYCGRVFPVRDSLIKGDSVVTFDTLYVPGEIRRDTIIRERTVEVTITKTVPQILTRRVTKIDTIVRENMASLKSCEIDKSKLISTTQQLLVDSNKAKHGRNIWRIIALVSIGFNVVGAYFQLSKMKLLG